MKIDRLIGILSVLLQRDTVTAPYLADKFEVSRRTINRDIETLCQAGIPIVTRQGAGGGISVMENYKLNSSLFTSAEMEDILAGLRGLDSVNGSNRYKQLMEKLAVGASDFMVGNQSVLIDLSSWYKDTLAPKIELLRGAIRDGREVKFLYFAPGGESRRRIRPYYVIFRWSSWYVWGWCCTKADYRLFKLNRMDDVTALESHFVKEIAPLPMMRDEGLFHGKITAKALFEAECKWRLAEEFGRDCFEVQKDGKLMFAMDFSDEEYLISWILTFGERVELLEPLSVREKLRGITREMSERYL